MNESMRAVRLHEIGGPENLKIENVARPQAGPGDVLVRVHAAALNRRDLFITQGLYPKIRLPLILGADGAGTIAELGSDVRDLAIGTEVVIDPMLGWGDDPHVWSADATILGMPRDGTFAEYVVVPRENVDPKPVSLTMEQAAAIPLAGLTAFRALVTRGEIKAGETVLLPGIGGGVQTFALLFAKQSGARVVVTSGSEQKLARARALGADVTIDYNAKPDWHKELRASENIDLVVDSSGGDTLAKSLACIRPGGRIVIYGGTRTEATMKLFPLFWNHIDIRGTSMGSPRDFEGMLARFDGSIEPAIDHVYPLEEAAGAVARLATSDQFGKVVLSV